MYKLSEGAAEMLEAHNRGSLKGEFIPTADIQSPFMPAVKGISHMPSMRLADNLCPGIHLNQDHDDKRCPYLDNSSGKCRLAENLPEMNAISKIGVHLIELMFGIQVPTPFFFKCPTVYNSFEPAARIQLLTLYDSYLATSESHIIGAGVLSDELKEESETRKRIFDEAITSIYDDTTSELGLPRGMCECQLQNNDMARKYSEDELVDAYEKAQYFERQRLGEPVVFRDGRCMFYDYVINQGYRPGPFPGLRWYTLNGEQVNPDEFSKWLSDNSRDVNHSFPVGYPECYFSSPDCRFAFKGCGIRFAHILKYFSYYYGVIGPETYGYFKKLPFPARVFFT